MNTGFPWINPSIVKKINKNFRLAGKQRALADKNKVEKATAKGELNKLDPAVILRHFDGEQS